MEQIDKEEQIQLLQKNDHQKDQFLGQVTHDLRAPLNVVNHLLDDIQKLSSYNQEILRKIEMCKCNSNMLMNLINDILDYAQIKGDSMKLNLQFFSIKQTLLEIEEMMNIQFELRYIKLVFKNKIHPDDDLLYSDQRRLKQVLINLLTNALKFTTQGTVIVEAQFYQSDKNLIKLQVSDTGIGIKQERVQLLGLPYATFNDLNLNNSGIGLGLFICKKIIGKLGPSEELFVQSEYGVGSKFGFLIFSQIQLKQNPQLYNFKSFFSITPKNRARIFSFERILTSNDQKKSRESKFKTQSRTLKIGRSSSINNESSNQLIYDVNGIEDNNNNNFEFDNTYQNMDSIRDCQLNHSQLEISSPEFAHFSPEDYLTKPKKPINNNSSHIKCNQEEVKLEENRSIIVSSPHFSFEDREKNNNVLLLLADDDIFNLMILENLLKESDLKNIEIIKAFNGMQAQDLFLQHNSISTSQQTISLIIMDCFMPILDGYTATKHIKEFINSGKYIDCAIIAYTANSGIQEEEKCKLAGFDSYLFKPTNKRDLIAAVKNYLN